MLEGSDRPISDMNLRSLTELFRLFDSLLFQIDAIGDDITKKHDLERLGDTIGSLKKTNGSDGIACFYAYSGNRPLFMALKILWSPIKSCFTDSVESVLYAHQHDEDYSILPLYENDIFVFQRLREFSDAKLDYLLSQRGSDFLLRYEAHCHIHSIDATSESDNNDNVQLMGSWNDVVTELLRIEESEEPRRKCSLHPVSHLLLPSIPPDNPLFSPRDTTSITPRRVPYCPIDFDNFSSDEKSEEVSFDKKNFGVPKK